MIAQSLELLSEAYENVTTWFRVLFDSVNAYSLTIALVLAFVVFRFIIMPFVGTGSSDSVIRKGGKK